MAPDIKNQDGDPLDYDALIDMVTSGNDEASRISHLQRFDPRASKPVDFDPHRDEGGVLDTSEEARNRRLRHVAAEAEDT